MPPYKAAKSRAQVKKLFALAEQGKISEADARGKTRAANFSTLPNRVGGKRGKTGLRGKRSPRRPAAR